MFQLFKVIMLERCLLTVLELIWNQRLGHKKTKLIGQRVEGCTGIAKISVQFSSGRTFTSFKLASWGGHITFVLHTAVGVNFGAYKLCKRFIYLHSFSVIITERHKEYLDSSVQSIFFILFAFINYSTKLQVIIIHLAGSPGNYFAYLKDCLKKRSKKLECKLSMAEQKY